MFQSQIVLFTVPKCLHRYYSRLDIVKNILINRQFLCNLSVFAMILVETGDLMCRVASHIQSGQVKNTYNHKLRLGYAGALAGCLRKEYTLM
jgi:hypothetical protein